MPVLNFPIDKAYLVGGWLASAFWGAFTMLMCVWGVSLSRSKTRTPLIFILAIIFIYILSTVHISLILARLIQAFIVHVNEEGAILYLANIGAPLNRSKDMVYVSVIVCGDLIILWRCFLVWNKSCLIVAIPSLMVLGTAISGYGAIAHLFLPNFKETMAIKWAQSMLVVSMLTNILITGLIAGRIWYFARTPDAKYFGLSLRYTSVIILIVESGLFMAISKIIEFTLFQFALQDGFNGLNAMYIPLDCMPQISGICSTFIMLAFSTGLLSPGTSAYGGNWSCPRPGSGLGHSNIGAIEFSPKGREIVRETTLSVHISSETQKYYTPSTSSV